MVVIERGYAGQASNELLKSMFEERKKVFVDLLHWDVPVIDGRFEVDQFDDEHAIYVIVADEGGRHLGSARLLPTLGPHILGDLYPQLCAGAVPRRPDTFEITRFCLGPGQGASRRRQTRNGLVSALVQVALDLGIRTYTGVAEVAWLQQILAFGWDCRPLGPPQTLNGSLLGALEIAIAADTPALLEANGIWRTADPADTDRLAVAA